MYIVENRVFYTGANLKLKEGLTFENRQLFDNVISNANINQKSYWFNRFNVNNDYIAFEVEKENNNDFFVQTFNKNLSVDNNIKKLIIKIHPNGISSTEVFFYINEEEAKQVILFDNYLDEFSNSYGYTIFELVFKLNQILETLQIVKFNKQYQYGKLLNGETLISDSTLKVMSDSYLLRVHLFTNDSEKYLEINNAYQDNSAISNQSSLIINDNTFSIQLYWAFVLWNGNDGDISTISQLLDLDSYTMNEIVIYNVVGEVYTELMYSIDFNKKLILSSNSLFDMYKTNAYYLQKNKLLELYFNENVNHYVSSQRSIEKFNMQEETYNNCEKKFFDVYHAVETNEKITSNRIIQNILTTLTLLTIISVATGIAEFIKAKFLNENVNVKIDIFSRVEFIAILTIVVFFLFLQLRQHMRKI
ncbi:MAG: hypothetical protein KU28_04570 [Sulfurovum sp. PC08-66]|nr:MAG: hypothetical protein KU28_04570 [Sulfurovum sp. PC08-66]